MKIVLYTISLLIVLVSLSIADTGKVIQVSDGDTITVLIDNNKTKVRLYGIDCPENKQHIGFSAKSFTSELVLGKIVTIETYDIDKYGRTIGNVFVNGDSLSEELVKVGYALVYTKYCKLPICQQWYKYEKEAKSKQFGIWSKSNPTPPWDFRKQQY